MEGQKGLVVHTQGTVRTVFGMLKRTAEVKSRFEDLGLNRTILLKCILKFRMAGTVLGWTHLGDGGGCQG